MQLATGTRLAHYEIVSLAGKGGMGEVYVARDQKLHRQVALKLLPEEFTRDADRLMRFDREARLLASLSHPHIGAIFGLEEVDGARFLVMELIAGETLADRITRGPLPVEESIAIARQVAEALEAAHEKGIIHRDLKPANIKVDDNGSVKVLDFGLAKAMGVEDTAADITASPTIVKGSHTGMILGTAAYMSPEQARGKSVDRRTDVWAFGVVLWEMLTGHRPFTGETVTDALISVATQEPEWNDLPANTPEPLRRLLRRCLAKSPRDRLHDLGDARLDLLEATQPAARGPGIATAPPKPSAIRWALPILLLILGLAAGFVIANTRRPKAVTTPIRAAINLPEGTQLAGWASPAVAISPDGTVIAFVANRGGVQELYIRRLDEFEARRVEGSEGAEGPFFSPDGKWVGFGAGSISGRSAAPPMLKKAPSAGGGAQPLSPLSDYFGGTWGDDGFIYFSAEASQGLWRIAADGGKAEQLRLSQPLPQSLFWPQFVPGAGIIAVREVDRAEREVVLVDLPAGTMSTLNTSAMFARVIGGRLLVFARLDGSLLAAPFSVKERKPTGTASPILSDVALSANGAAVLAVSESGTAVWAQGFVRGSGRELRLPAHVDAHGKITPMEFEPDALSTAQLSPDGTRMVVSSWTGELWIYDLERKTRTRLPAGDSYRAEGPIWSNDGASILANSDDPGSQQLVIQSADGSDSPRKLLPATRGEYWPASFTPDGRSLIYFTWGIRPDQRGWEMWVFSLGDPSSQRKIGEGYGPQLSPDGRWLAYESIESGSWEVHLQSFPIPVSKTVISRAGGRSPSWSRDSGRLYFWEGYTLMAVDVKGSGRSDIGLPVKVFDAPELDVGALRRVSRLTPIGDGFITLAPVPGSGVQKQLKLDANWLDEVERKVAGR